MTALMDSYSQHSVLLLLLEVSDLLTGSNHVDVLDTHNTTSPGSTHLLVIVELELELSGELLEVNHVFLVDAGEGNAGSSLLVDESTKGSLSSDEAVGDILLSAESREEAHDFNGINVM